MTTSKELELTQFRGQTKEKMKLLLAAVEPWWRSVAPKGWSQVLSENHYNGCLSLLIERMVSEKGRGYVRKDADKFKTVFSEAFPLSYDLALRRYVCDLTKMCETGLGVVICDDNGAVVFCSMAYDLADCIEYPLERQFWDRQVIGRRDEVLHACENGGRKSGDFFEEAASGKLPLGKVLCTTLVAVSKRHSLWRVFATMRQLLDFYPLLLGYELTVFQTTNPVTLHLAKRSAANSDWLFHDGSVDLLSFAFADDVLFGDYISAETERLLRKSDALTTVDAFYSDMSVIATQSRVPLPSALRALTAANFLSADVISAAHMRFVTANRNAFALHKIGPISKQRSKL